MTGNAIENPKQNHHLKVLVVDDVDSQRYAVKNFIANKYGWEVIEAKDGIDAIEKTLEHDFNLIISDLVMPYMNGLELCAFLKSDPNYHTIPFVILSSVNERETIEQAKSLGASEYLLKPLHEHKLRQTIDLFLGNTA